METLYVSTLGVSANVDPANTCLVTSKVNDYVSTLVNSIMVEQDIITNLFADRAHLRC
jgi:hypothetical protein